MKILVINSGSSSIKYKLFEMPKEQLIQKGLIEHIGENGAKIKDHYTGLKIILSKLNIISAVGHRVVQGAEEFQRSVLINNKVIKKIKECSSIAPLHNPANLAGILACQKLLPAIKQVAVFDTACQKLLPGIKQVAVFDTAFHQTLPDYAFIYGLPFEFYQKFGIRKYGFHGTSHEYVAGEGSRRLKMPINKLKIITCHLGNGCSITAINRGRSIDTSMGFTPLEGLIMGTRCGDIDPALVTYIMEKKRFKISQINDILNKQSGLKGISGMSNDMRLLVSEARQGNRRAKLAIDIFVYRVKKYIGAYTAIMGGCDALVFTAGIGEHQKEIRKKICQGIFSALKKTPKILVIPTDEELMISRQTYQLIRRREKCLGPF